MSRGVHVLLSLFFVDLPFTPTVQHLSLTKMVLLQSPELDFFVINQTLIFDRDLQNKYIKNPTV